MSMKKLFLSMLLLTLHVHALTLSVNSANNNSEPFSILHIINDSEFECLAEELPHGKKAYSCVFEQEIITDVSDQATPSMDIKFVKFEDGFELIVLPKANSYIRPMGDRLFDDVDVHGTNISKKSKHWVVVVFQKIDFLKVNSEDGIDFPVEYSEFLKPSVGALDLNGAPIEYVGSKDINTFLDVKKLYERKDYESALSQAQEALMLYPDTIFKSELLLYKIRALDKVLQSENSYTELSESDLISDAKYWNNNIATEENMPEVLSYIVRNYIRMGFASEANYFLDILLTEYPSNKY